ncbi:MAG: glycosyltransferase family 39 protein [Candidatus Moranbacteria bacterium]|nr:glycosyltransferase family 39 protein [Candidatus Moranbacteria bacterium]
MSSIFQSTRDLFQKNKKEAILIVLLLLIFCIRLSFLTVSPPGFYADESSFGYNAYSISQTAHDEHGMFMPVYFEAFGDYKNPVYVYILVPFIKLLGLSVFTIRFTSAIMGIGSIILFIFFVYFLTGNKKTSLFGGLILSLLPWHFHFSRIGFEAMTFVFFVILSLLFLVLFVRKDRPLYYLGFGLSNIVAFFAYSTGRLIIPTMVLIAVILWWRKIFLRWKIILISIFCALLLFSILFYDHSKNSTGILARPASLMVWNGSPSLSYTVGRFLLNYVNHFSPQFLFQSGDMNTRHSSGVSSMLPTIFAIPVLLGIAYFVKTWKKEKFSQYILLQLLLFPLASSLTIIEDGGQAIRTIHAVPFFALTAALGLEILFVLFKKIKFANILLVSFLCFEMIFFYVSYFTVYPNKSINDFNRGLPEAMETIFSRNNATQYIISDSAYQGFDEAPFFSKFDPATYQKLHYVPNVVKIRPSDLEQPKAGSEAIFSAGDDIPHFPNEKLIKTVSFPLRVVQYNENTGKDEYKIIDRKLYYIYEYN